MFVSQITIHTKDEIYEGVADDVVAWHTTKNYGSPTGSWSMSLVPRKRDGKTWFEKLSAQDFVRIKLAIGNGPFETVMSGLINRVYRSITTNPATGEVTEVVRLDGSDLGKVLNQFHAYYDPWSSSLNAIILGRVHMSELMQDLSPAKLLEGLLALVLDDDDSKIVQDVKRKIEEEGGQSLLSAADFGNRGVELKDELKFNASIPEDTIANVAEIVTFQGAYWNAFMKFANEPWNEVFVDNGAAINSEDRAGQGGAPSLRTEADTTYVNLREAPFTDERFEKLVTHEISYDDIQVPFEVAKGDTDTYTYYFARPTLTTKLGNPLYAEVVTASRPITRGREGAVGIIERFGFRPLRKDFLYGLPGQEPDVVRRGSVQLARDLSELLFEFFDRNSEFLTGTVGLKVNRLAGNTNTLAKMGHRLRIVGNPKGYSPESYYITGVTNQWAFSNTFTQMLTLTRGRNETRSAA